MSELIVIPRDVNEPGVRYLKERGYEVKVGNGSWDPAYLKSIIRDADGILARTGEYSADVLSEAKHLRVIGRFGVGMDSFDLDYCRAHGIRVVNTPGANAESVAEHTIGQMLALSHRFLAYDTAVRACDWSILNRSTIWDLMGKTLGIVGLGHIGTLIARKAEAAFSMRVIGYSPRPPRLEQIASLTLMPDLESLFSQADYVVLCLPLNADTQGLIDAKLLSCMKRESYLINNARGGVLNEAALVEALREHRIAGAALDVYAHEPLGEDDPILQAPNLLLTPHSAALTVESMDRMGLEAAIGIDDVLSGREPKYPVV